jgi:hypothetical protein
VENALASLCFDDLASGYRTHSWATRAAGYRAAISCIGTSETFQPALIMSDVGGEADLKAVRPDFSV